MVLFELVVSMNLSAQVSFINQDLAQAIDQAKKDRKHILVDVYADWCGWCKKMDATTFKDQEVADFIDRNMIALKINSEHGQGKAFAQKYGVKGLPTMVYLDHQGGLVRTVPGFKNAADLLKDLLPYELKNGSGSTQHLLEDYFEARLMEEKKMSQKFSSDSTVLKAYRYGQQKAVYPFDELKYKTNSALGVRAASKLQVFYDLGDGQFRQALEVLTQMDESAFSSSETHFLVFMLTKNGLTHLKLLQMINSISTKTTDLGILSTKVAVQLSMNDTTDAKETYKALKKCAKKKRVEVPQELKGLAHGWEP